MRQFKTIYWGLFAVTLSAPPLLFVIRPIIIWFNGYEQGLLDGYTADGFAARTAIFEASLKLYLFAVLLAGLLAVVSVVALSLGLHDRSNVWDVLLAAVKST